MKNSALILFLLSLSPFTFGQNPKVTLTISPADAEIGETITITVKTSVRGEVEIDNLPSSFVYSYNVLTGSEQSMDHNTGVVTTYYYMSQTGVISKPGKYTIGPAFVKSGSKTYSSGKVTVSIGQQVPMNLGTVSAQQLKDPALGIIQLNKTTIYEGEPVLAEAKVFAKYNPTNINDYRSFSIKGALETHSLQGNKDIRVVQERFKGNKYYSFEYDKQLIFPSGTGNFQVDPFRMNLLQGFQGFPITSSAAMVTIKPLPGNAPNDFIGAVGEFSIARELDTTEIKQGDVFKMWITINGIGNIQNTIEPMLNLPKGFIVYGDPVVTENISYTSRGAQGSILYEYNVQVTRHGEITLPGTTISYFDLSQEKYIQVGTSSERMTIEKDANYVVAENPKTSQNAEELNPQQISLRTQQSPSSVSTIYGTLAFWSGVGIPMFGGLFFLLLKRKNEQDAEEIAAKQKVKQKVMASQRELTLCKTLLEDSEASNDAFFSSVEIALKKAFEGKMNVQEDRILNKNEIYQFLRSENELQLLEDVQFIFSVCENSRFGLVASNESRQQTFDALTAVINRLKL